MSQALYRIPPYACRLIESTWVEIVHNYFEREVKISSQFVTPAAKDFDPSNNENENHPGFVLYVIVQLQVGFLRSFHVNCGSRSPGDLGGCPRTGVYIQFLEDCF
jgi:hypothetical protein